MNYLSPLVEYSDPYASLSALPDFIPFNHEETFSFPSDLIDENHMKLYAVCIPLNILMSKVSQNDGSMSGLLALLLSRAIDAVHPDYCKAIGFSSPFDLRKTLQCENSLRNCNQSIKYIYSEKLKKYTFEEQLSIMKGMLYFQMMDEHQLPRYAMVRDRWEEIKKTKTINEKQELFSLNS